MPYTYPLSARRLDLRPSKLGVLLLEENKLLLTTGLCLALLLARVGMALKETKGIMRYFFASDHLRRLGPGNET